MMKIDKHRCILMNKLKEHNQGKSDGGAGTTGE
jgi:hypothetical protein